jgi:tRNA-2-methylthio-N6-dimethylallyladenosine synthase
MYIDLMNPKKQAEKNSANPRAKKVHIETYGCQMNIADSELVASILADDGFALTDTTDNADVILLNTCSIRDNAEQKIFHRLSHLRHYKKKKSKLVVGILGCMAERLKSKLIGERDLVSIVVGPDEYRSLPSLVNQAFKGEQGVAVELSKVETYEDITPLRTEGVSAWLSIMRGCNNFCAFCVVPYTRGRERSSSYRSILEQSIGLYENGVREVTLLGQNVNSYNDTESGIKFPQLLEGIAKELPDLRIRYSTSHPHDMSDELIYAHQNYDNICNFIHLPIQSGSSKILKKMRRDYTAEKYLERIDMIRNTIPNVALSTDIIAGYCTETEEDHQMTMDLMKEVRYDGAFMFKYSERGNTLAQKKYPDDVPEEVKQRRLEEIIFQQRAIAGEINATEVGKTHEVLVEGPSKKKEELWQGRTDTNKMCIFPYNGEKEGDKLNVKVVDSNSATLFVEVEA